MGLDEFNIPGMDHISIFLRIVMDVYSLSDTDIDEAQNNWPRIGDSETPLFGIESRELRALAALKIINFKKLTNLQIELKLRQEAPTGELQELRSYVELLQNIFYFELRSQHPELWNMDFGVRDGYIVVKVNDEHTCTRGIKPL